MSRRRTVFEIDESLVVLLDEYSKFRGFTSRTAALREILDAFRGLDARGLHEFLTRALHRKVTQDVVSSSVTAAEVVTAAAIYIDGVTVSLPRPARHGDVIALANDFVHEDVLRKAEQGFLTSKGRFVSRGLALHLAEVAGQLKGPRKSGARILTSEDVW